MRGQQPADRPILDPGLRVLVVEDSPVMRDLIRVVMEVSGVVDICALDNAEDGFASVIAFRPQLVITDWELPAESGLDLLHRIRRDPASPDPGVPVIVLTGHHEPARLRAALDGGAHAFVPKPVGARALRDRILEVMGDRRPFVRCNAYVGPDRRDEPRHPVEWRPARPLRPSPA